jgi:hypothetical protein
LKGHCANDSEYCSPLSLLTDGGPFRYEVAQMNSANYRANPVFMVSVLNRAGVQTEGIGNQDCSNESELPGAPLFMVSVSEIG